MMGNRTKIKTYWSGNKRIISDIFWCLCLAILVPVANKFIAEKKVAPSSHTNITMDSNSCAKNSLSGKSILDPQTPTEAACDDFFALLGAVLANFFLFFFWSWNREHVKCRLARVVIHIFCWTFFLLYIGLTGMVLYVGPNFFSGYIGWGLLFFTTVPIFFIAKKYLKLMKSENLQ